MASRKEYEMLFNLNAKLNGGFTGTFTAAQAEFVQLGNEIQELSKIQSDISAYEKQQAAVTKTELKLKNLNEQYALLEQEIKETEGSTANLEREKLKLSQRINDTESALSKQQQKLDATGESLKSAGVNTDSLSEKSAELEYQIAELSKEQEKAAESAENFGEKSVSAVDAMSSALAAAGIEVALHKIYDEYMQCVSAAGNFEESMSNVEALSGAGTQELELLSTQAKEFGANTKFAALESADAMGYMGMAGWNAQQMLAGMPGVLNLAAASGEDLANVSDIVTDSLSGFKLQAADTSEFVDVLAAAATKSNTNVSMMGESFKYAAPLCGTLGYSAQDAAIALGLMANNGTKGSQAGTTLKTALANLSAPTAKQAAEMERLNISITDGNGEMLSLMDLLTRIRSSFSGLSEAEQSAAASTIFGKEAMSGMLAIVNTSQKDFDSLTQSIYNSAGAAQKMADIKMDNLNGQLTLMRSAGDGLRITIGEQFIPIMRELYSAGTDVLGNINAFVAENPSLITSVGAFAGVIGVATSGLTAYAAISKVVKALDMASVFTSPVGATIALVTGIAALVAAFAAAVSTAEDAESEYKNLTLASQAQYDELQRLNDEYDRTVELYGENSYEAWALRQEIDSLSEAYEEGKQSLKDFNAACEQLHTEISESRTAYRDAVTEIDNEYESSNALIAKLGELSDKTNLTSGEQAEMSAIVDELNTRYEGLGLKVDNVTGKLNLSVSAIKAVAQAEADQKTYQENYQRYIELLQQMSAHKKLVAAATDSGTVAQERYVKALSAYNEADAARTTSGWLLQLIDLRQNEGKALNDARDDLETYTNSQITLDAVYVSLLGEQTQLVMEMDEYTRAMSGAGGSADETGTSITNLVSRITELTETYNAVYSSAQSSVQGQYSLWDTAADIIPMEVGSINAALENQIDYWQRYNSNLENLRGRTKDIEGLSDVIAQFADGSAESVNAVAGMADATDEELAAMVENYKTLQEEQDSVAENIAEVVTDYQNKMDELVAATEDAVNDMDMSSAAAQSGRNTVGAYIDGAMSLKNEVWAAFASLAQTSQSALASVSVTSALGIAASIPGYASGTQSAEAGFAVVGENGPELVYFNGGEQVVNASETAAMQRRAQLPAMSASVSEYNSAPTIQVFFQIGGDATPETVDALRDYGDEFAERVISVLEEYRADAARRVY